MEHVIESSPWFDELRREGMREADEVAAMLRLQSLGWSVRRIAAEFGCSPTTVRRYVAAGGWTGYRAPRRAKALDGLDAWLAERCRRHRGNADVVRQDLAREKGIAVSPRTVERAVAPLRQQLAAEARATVRFETPPGRQLQIDFGEMRVLTGAESVRARACAPYGRGRRARTSAASAARTIASAFHCGNRPAAALTNAAAILT